MKNDRKLTGTLHSWFDGRLASMSDDEIFSQLQPISGGSKQSWSEALAASSVDSTNLTASITRTTILPPAAVFTLPANFFEVGKVLKLTLCGRLGNVVTTPGTLTIDVGIGAVVAFNGGAQAMSTTAHTTLPYWLEILLTCRAIGNGTSANLMGQGRITSQAVSNTQVADADTTTIKTLLLPNTTPAVGTGFDSTVAQTVNVFGTFSISNANAILTHQYILEAKN